MAEIFARGAGGIAGTVQGGIGRGGGPIDVGDQFDDIGEGGCFHHLKILLVLRGSSGG
jgi:hypothetical protein